MLQTGDPYLFTRNSAHATCPSKTLLDQIQLPLVNSSYSHWSQTVCTQITFFWDSPHFRCSSSRVLLVVERTSEARGGEWRSDIPRGMRKKLKGDGSCACVCFGVLSLLLVLADRPETAGFGHVPGDGRSGVRKVSGETVVQRLRGPVSGRKHYGLWLCAQLIVSEDHGPSWSNESVLE